jgi:UDP-N-acetylmuramyl tripeptide synthase
MTGQGEGSSIGGAVARRLWPNLLADLAEDAEICLVTGTNGKSTTAHMLAACLASNGPVAFNSGGSNMENGAVVALARTPGARSAVLEIDEAFLGSVAENTRPRVIVLLNLTRESTRGVVVSELQRSWSAFFSTISWDCEFVANADDPIVVSTLPQDAKPHWVAGGDGWTSDSAICPRCHATLARSNHEWWCDTCGLTRPKAAWHLEGDAMVGSGFSEPLTLMIPGGWPRSNALFAVAAAQALGLEPSESIAAIARIDDVEGRYKLRSLEGRDVRLIMVKNADRKSVV